MTFSCSPSESKVSDGESDDTARCKVVQQASVKSMDILSLPPPDDPYRTGLG